MLWVTRIFVAACFSVAVAVSSTLAQDAKRPLGASDITGLLGSGVSQARVADLVDQRGVTFEVTPAIKDQLRAAGAGSEVLGAVDRASLQAERRKLEAERKKMDEERKAEEAAAEADKKRQAAAEAAAKKAEADAKKKADRERAQREAEETGDVPAPAAKAAKGKAADGMVTVAGGSFFMGCNESVDSECDDNEKPGGTVEVPAFKIDRTEVTVAQFARCVDAGRCSSNGLAQLEQCNWQKPGREEHPINCVDWYQAVAYCEWAGKRLPSEAEWEKAARGTDGRKYPWGNAGFGVAGRVANISGSDDGYEVTAPVGSFPAGASPSGALDMIGNVWEWTAEPLEPGHSIRGGSWTRGPRSARASDLDFDVGADRNYGIGFRCAE